MEFKLNLKGIKTPTDANWNSILSGGYQNIKGRVYDFSRVKEGYKNPDGTIQNPYEDANGYWKATAELTGLISPFTNPISNAAVSETRIEVSFEDTRGWGRDMGETYYGYIAASAKSLLEKKYAELFGVRINLTAIKVAEPPIEEAPPAAITTTTEIAPATASVAGPTASETTASVSAPTASNIDGEFTFNVEQEGKFIGNNQFGTLYIVGIGEIKEEPVEMVFEETLDEEYSEVDFAGAEEGAFVTPDQVVWPEDRATSPDFKEEAPSNIPIETISGLSPWSMKLVRKAKGENWEAHAANYISLKEGFVANATWDENHYRMGFGSDKILKGGKLTEVMKGDKCTLTEATETLSTYGIPNFSKTIKNAIGSTHWEKLNAYQKASLVSLGYNVGQYYITARGYGKRIRAAIVEGNMQKAAQEILNGPSTASGKLLRPLKERRKEEAQLFLQPIGKSIYK